MIVLMTKKKTKPHKQKQKNQTHHLLNFLKKSLSQKETKYKSQQALSVHLSF